MLVKLVRRLVINISVWANADKLSFCIKVLNENATNKTSLTFLNQLSNIKRSYFNRKISKYCDMEGQTIDTKAN